MGWGATATSPGYQVLMQWLCDYKFVWVRHAVNKSWKPGHVDGHVKHDGMRGHSVAQSQPHFTITSTCTFQVTNRHSSQSTKHKHKAESTQSTKHKAQHAKHTAQSTKCQAQSTQPKAQSTCTKHRAQSTKHMHKQECMACRCSPSPSKPLALWCQSWLSHCLSPRSESGNLFLIVIVWSQIMHNYHSSTGMELYFLIDRND